jgi:hypothetical protein
MTRMNTLHNLRSSTFNFLLVVICIFAVNIVALCQEDDEDVTRESTAYYVEPGTACSIYSLDNEEIDGEAGPRWLAGNPTTAEVGLISSSRPGMVNKWRITRVGEDPDIYTIECSANGKQRWLYGNTNNGLISLASGRRDDGAKWLLKKIHDDPYIYRIQVYSRGPKRWLFGDTYEGNIGLRRDASHGNPDIFNSDTSWEIMDRFGNDLEIS